MRLFQLITCGTFLALFAACSPKAPTAETTPATPSQPVVTKDPNEVLSPCKKFSDSPNSDQLSDNYVIYRDFLGTNQIDKAYELWQTVYAEAPAADGRRNTVLTDGIYFMEYFASQTPDVAKRKEYQNRVFEFYDKIEECYPEGGYVPARKGFDYFYKNPELATKQQQYALFKEAIAIDGMKVGDFILNPLSSLLVDLHQDKTITDAEAREYSSFIMDRIAAGKAEAKTATERERWSIIEGYAPERLTYFETVPGFYDCSYYKKKYLPLLAEEPDDCVLLAQTAGYLKFGGCEMSDTEYTRLVNQYKAKCQITTPVVDGPMSKLRNGDYNGAVKGFEEKYNESSDPQKKAQYAMLLAKVYYGNLKQYSNSRKWAREALKHRPNWGDPYILIGKLYASSGPLCGPGTGFKSQRVVWVATDKWQKAKRVDPSVSAEANKLINRYAKYAPKTEDYFQAGLKKGDKYKVDCWINETTTIR